ncbi:MAG: substrate-binding domain-containing protein [Planctomycetia bacterium]|nr:substrate-binding domain-containing protein [Planctomycetia bacterium]
MKYGNTKEIVLLLETSRQHGRSILQGVIQWSHRYGPIRLRAGAGHLLQELPRLGNWKNIGLISRLTVPGIVEAIDKYHIKTIVLEPNTDDQELIQKRLKIPSIRINPETTGQMAADYLYDHGFQKFAFCGFSCRSWSDRREEAFVRAIEKRHMPVTSYNKPKTELPWSREKKILRDWLKSLPQPIGIFACDDDRARQLLEICEEEGLSVPAQYSILGAADDELLCELTSVPLSSIAFDLERAGYRAMSLLSDMIDGKVKNGDDIIVEPLWVVPRLSTDYAAQPDRIVRAALRYIRSNYLRPISVPDLLENLDVSRRSLEVRLMKATGRTIMENIIHRRVERARQLLITTDDSIERIGVLAGFVSYRSMLSAFSSILGCTPKAVREMDENNQTKNDKPFNS